MAAAHTYPIGSPRIEVLLWNVSPLELGQTEFNLEIVQNPTGFATDVDYRDITSEMYDIGFRRGIDLRANTVGGVRPGSFTGRFYDRVDENGNRKFNPSNPSGSELYGFLKRGNCLMVCLGSMQTGSLPWKRVCLWLGKLDDMKPLSYGDNPAQTVQLSATGILSLIPFDADFVPGLSRQDFTADSRGLRQQIRADEIIGNMDLPSSGTGPTNKPFFIYSGDRRDWSFWPGGKAISPREVVTRLAHTDGAFLFENARNVTVHYYAPNPVEESPKLYIRDTDEQPVGYAAALTDPSKPDTLDNPVAMRYRMSLGKAYNSWQATVGEYVIDELREEVAGDGLTKYGQNSLNVAELRLRSALDWEVADQTIPANGISKWFTAPMRPSTADFKVFNKGLADGNPLVEPLYVLGIANPWFDTSFSILEGRSHDGLYTPYSTGQLSIHEIEWCIDAVRFKVRNHTSVLGVLNYVNFRGFYVGFRNHSNRGNRVFRTDDADIEKTGVRRYNFSPQFESKADADWWFDKISSRYDEDARYADVDMFIRLDSAPYTDLFNVFPALTLGSVVQVHSDGYTTGSPPSNTRDMLYTVVAMEVDIRDEGAQG